MTELLGVLTSDGATCRYHGDFDWHGLRIAQAIRTKIAWLPWRYGCIDYREAVRDVIRSAGCADQPPLRLIGSPAQAPWDPDLALAMAEEGLAVEEALVESLAADVMAC